MQSQDERGDRPAPRSVLHTRDGVVLTYAFNLWLMEHYEVPRLAWYYLPVGALVLFALGQLAVLGPAGRAATVSPAVATRSA